jgi:hypothetical protein
MTKFKRYFKFHNSPDFDIQLQWKPRLKLNILKVSASLARLPSHSLTHATSRFKKNLKSLSHSRAYSRKRNFHGGHARYSTPTQTIRPTSTPPNTNSNYSIKLRSHLCRSSYLIRYVPTLTYKKKRKSKCLKKSLQ